MSGKPDFDAIEARDLQDDGRLALLYGEAVRRRFWPNSPHHALEFVALAEKSLADDRLGTPGRLFYGLIKAKDASKVSQAAEDRALHRFPSDKRQALVESARARGVVERPASGAVDDVFSIKELGFAPAVMMQCFLPQKPIGERTYETRHGNSTLAIEAGRLANPRRPGSWMRCDVPAGAKPRLILPYIVGAALRHKTREVDLGRSLRAFMKKLRVPVTGNNGKVLTREVQNVAAANVLIGEWGEDAVHTHAGRVAKQVSFWLERDPDQLTFWNPTMTLSSEFYDMVQRHRVPIDMAHLVRLARSPRRMDLYCWLSYRTPWIQDNVAQPVSLRGLWDIFAPDITEFANMRKRIAGDLKAIAEVYPHFKVEVRGDILWLRQSPPPVPFKPG